MTTHISKPHGNTGRPLSEAHKKAVGDGVARGRRKPVGLAPVPNLGGCVYVLWSDGEVEFRQVKP